jgi:hypothetical protein
LWFNTASRIWGGLIRDHNRNVASFCWETEAKSSDLESEHVPMITYGAFGRNFEHPGAWILLLMNRQKASAKTLRL